MTAVRVTLLVAALAGMAADPPKPDVRFVATPPEVVDKMLEVGRITAKDVVYDLGCGDGRIVLAAARRYGCRAVGIDIDPERIKECEASRGREPAEIRKLVSFAKGDLFTADLRPATVVMLYLRPELNVRLLPQLRKLRAGARVVSHNWDLRGVQPDAAFPVTVVKKDGYSRLVYRWTTPLVERAED